jgi:hypothetical protein
VRDDRVERSIVEESPFRQHGLEGGDSRLDRRERLRVVRVIVG